MCDEGEEEKATEATEEEEEEKEEEKAAGAELKTKTPHKDVGNKKINDKCCIFHCHV